MEPRLSALWHLPWSTFGAFLVLVATILLALGWAAWDRRRGDAEEDR